MSIQELWVIVFSKVILALCVALGSAAGVATAVGLHAAGLETYGWVLLFAVAPIFINIGSASLMSAWVYLRCRKYDAQTDTREVVVIPSVLTIYISCLPFVAGIYGLVILSAGLDPMYFTIAMLVVPIVYNAISEFFHFVTFRYIAPTVWGRAHIFPDSAEPEADEEALALAGPQPEVTFQGQGIERTIGKSTFDESRLLYLEAQGNYLHVVTSQEKSLERHKISAAVDALTDDLGLYVHRSRWVAYKAVKWVEKDGRQLRIVVENGDSVEVASTRAKGVLRELARHNTALMQPIRDSNAGQDGPVP